MWSYTDSAKPRVFSQTPEPFTCASKGSLDQLSSTDVWEINVYCYTMLSMCGWLLVPHQKLNDHRAQTSSS